MRHTRKGIEGSNPSLSANRFSVRDRVLVRRDFHWARGASGTVSAIPPILTEMMAGDQVDAVSLAVPTLRGSKLQVWIVFDRPQRDGDGDGPYRAALIDASALMFVRHTFR